MPEKITGHYVKVPSYKDYLARCLEEPKLAECTWGGASVGPATCRRPGRTHEKGDMAGVEPAGSAPDESLCPGHLVQGSPHPQPLGVEVPITLPVGNREQRDWRNTTPGRQAPICRELPSSPRAPPEVTSLLMFSWQQHLTESSFGLPGKYPPAMPRGRPVH